MHGGLGKVEQVACGGNKEQLLRYLLVKAAPVMLKVRPAVLVRICNCSEIRGLQRYDHFCVHQQEIIEVLRTEYLILKNNGRDIQIMFYDRQRMAALLSDREVRSFLRGMGYPSEWTVEEHLAELRKRFIGDIFPHEIGVFLGYPLKDVVGFMEKRQPCLAIPRALWRVFGDPAESLRRMWMYRFAEDIGRYAIAQYQSVERCVEQIEKCFSDKIFINANQKEKEQLWTESM